MIILDSSLKSLEIKLGGTVTTNQLPFMSNYHDITTTTFTPISADGVSNNTTAVTVVTAPASSTQRQLKFFSIRNADTVAVTLTFQLNNNGTIRILHVTTMAVGDLLSFSDTEGFRQFDKNGNLYGTSASSSGFTAASQAEQEAGSSLTVGTTPGRQQYHPSAAKVWASFGVTGNILASYGVTSVTDVGAGLSRVNFSTSFSSVNYSVVGITMSINANIVNATSGGSGQAAGSIDLTAKDVAGSATDPTSRWFMAAFGDQ